MDMSKAFRLTIQRFGLRSVDVVSKSGVAESDVSRFINGKTNVGYKKVEKLLDALPPSAKDYFWILCKSSDSEALPLISCEKPAKYKVDKDSRDTIAV